MKKAIKSNASNYGLILAAIGIGYTLLAYLVDLKLMVNPFAGAALWVISIVLLVFAVNAAKKDMGGFITFRDAFSTFVLAYIINALISTVFTILLFTVVDPDAAEQVRDMSIESSVEMMENLGASDEQITETISAMDEEGQFSLKNQVQGFLWGIVIFAIIGLIVAAIMKKNPPAEMAEADTQTE